MIRRLLIPSLLLFTICRLEATHIVGGEFELKHVEDSTYQLKLITYFDDVNGNPQILQGELAISPYIFRKSDGFLMQIVNLNRTEFEDFVPYTNSECSIESLSTRKIVFDGLITLPPSQYDDPEGYLIVWERCCRNHTITNINFPDATGNKFLLEIPPVVKDGEPFINSSPSLFPPLSDYACINQLYYVDFAGTDTDGDSLTYKLVTPLNTAAVDAVPIPTAHTFIEAVWAPGISLSNVIPGNPSLAINPKGFITVSPFNTGLYVFSVLVEEFRDGAKIGELRRDFQMLVIDGCDPPDPPEVIVQKEDGEFYQEGDTLRFTVSESRCFDFLITDEVGEQVTIRAKGVNFEQKVEGIFEFTSGFLNNAQDTLSVEVCMPECPYVFGEPFLIDLIAGDQACPQPQLDTARLVIEVEPPPNQEPFFAINNKTKTVTIPESSSYSEELRALDPDDDRMFSSVVGEGFVPADWGMTFTVLQNDPGVHRLLFEWDTNCNLYDFGVRSNFTLKIAMGDEDFCGEPVADTVFYDLNVALPLNTSPVVSTTLGKADATVPIKGNISFDVRADDADDDLINLIAVGEGFDLNEKGANFNMSEGTGTTQSNFSWDLSCENLDITEDTTFRLYFISEDEDECRQINFDTLTFDVNVVVPFNNKPEFDLYPDYELPINVPFSLDIIANDLDNDFVNMALLDGFPLPPSPSFSFPQGTGQGSVESTLSWTPECSLLGDNDTPKDYTVFFLVWDDSCPNQKADTMAINFNISELTVDYNDFQPPNVFTPNGDSHNDTYKLEGLAELSQNLPPDNCADEFQSISIFDRTGKVVFFSRERNFEWAGTGLPAATYFYTIEYLNTDYKGTITILF